MTRPANDPSRFSDFSLWVRGNPAPNSHPARAALLVQDLDFVFHKYVVCDSSTGHIMARNHVLIVESKEHLADTNFAQRDTLTLVHQAFLYADKRMFKLARGLVKVFYHGIHLVQFENTSPTNGHIWWDRKPVTAEQLTAILRFDLDAYTLRPREDRSYHKSKWWPTLGKD